MLETGKFYHIYNHANGFENIFLEEKNYSFFLEKLYKHITPVANILGFCLMPNHFHLIIQIKDPADFIGFIPENKDLEMLTYIQIQRFISKQFSNLFSSYSQSFNKVYGRRGSLFMKNFRRKLIENEYQLMNTILYVHLNPVKHGFVRNHIDWKWTSYNFYFNPERLDHFNLSSIEKIFGNKEIFLKMHLEKQVELLKK